MQGTLNKPGDTDKGWSVEIAFPWEVLKECANRSVPPQNGDQWRINFSRVEWRTKVTNGEYKRLVNLKEVEGQPDNWVWSPQGLINMHYPEKWGYLQFSTKRVGTDTVEFIQHPARDEAMRVLMEIYYRQKEHYKKHQRYTDRLKVLEIKRPQKLNYCDWPPKLQVTDNLFEASIREKQDFDRDGKINHWHIRQDSKVWETEG